MLRAPLPTTLNDNLAIHSNASFWTVQRDQASLSAVLPTTPRRPVQTGRLRSNRAQSRRYRARFVKPPHMRVASGEITIVCWEAWIVLHREEELRESLIEAPAEQKRSANYIENLTARTETQRSLDTLDCSLKLAGKSLRMPPIYQPRANLGLSASARSTKTIMAPISSPK
jgi:hypothetical protein